MRKDRLKYIILWCALVTFAVTLLLVTGCGSQMKWTPRPGKVMTANEIEPEPELPPTESDADREARIRRWKIQSRLDMQADAFRNLAKTTRVGNQLQVQLNNIQFVTGSADLLPASARLLQRFAAILSRFPEDFIVVSGHTDSVGKASYNLRLSRMRARSVGQALIEGGVAKKAVRTEGFGETRPIAPNTTAEGKAMNRRVELSVTVEDMHLATR